MFRAMGQTAEPTQDVRTEESEYGERRNGGVCLYDEAFDAIPLCPPWEAAIPERCWLTENMLDPQCQQYGMDNPPPHDVCGELALLRFFGADDPAAAGQAEQARQMVMTAPSCSGRTRDAERTRNMNMIIGGGVALVAIGAVAYYMVKK